MLIEWDVRNQIDPAIMERMQAAADLCLTCENVKLSCAVSVCLCDDETIAEINRQYRGIDRSTDVLSFPNLEWEAPSDFDNLNVEDLEMSVNPETELTILGEICLNKDRIISQAEEYGHSVKREYAFLIAHSMLHLLGYDHMEEDEAKVMEEKQAAYLEMLGIGR